MTISVTFEPNTQFVIGVIAELLEFGFLDTVGELAPTTLDVSGSFYGDFVTVTGTGTDMGPVTDPITFDVLGFSGTLNTMDFAFADETVSFANTNFSLDEIFQLFVVDYENSTEAFIQYLVEQTWDMTLGDLDDVLTPYSNTGLAGNDIIRGNGGDDNLLTGNGHDRLYGGADNDRLNGGNGNDRIFGGTGDDVLIGDNGNDRLVGNDGNDRIIGGRGQDRIYGSDGLDRIYGGSSADVIIGGNDRDYVNGGIGNDRIYGGDGWDQLYGNAGNDLLVGGTGPDDFIFRDGQGDNIIRDFDALNNAEDIILRGVTAITDFGDLRDNHMVQVGADVVIDDGAGLTITLQNVDLGDLGARDFIF